jgi:hypothetical protein
MRGQQLLTPSPSSKLQVDRELAELSVQINQMWPSLPEPLPLAWTETPLISIDRSGVPWIIGPAEHDPLRTASGRTVIPYKQRAQLKRVAKLGVPFQRLAIAHELDPEGPVRELLPALRTQPQTCSNELARALVGEVPAHPGVTRAVMVLDAAVSGATSAVGINAVVSVLDPIIFGVIAPALAPPRHGYLCLWYPLVAWRW